MKRRHLKKGSATPIATYYRYKLKIYLEDRYSGIGIKGRCDTKEEALAKIAEIKDRILAAKEEGRDMIDLSGLPDLADRVEVISTKTIVEIAGKVVKVDVYPPDEDYDDDDDDDDD